MEENQLKKLKTWFDEYVAGFYGKMYLNLELSRAEVEERLNELLELERRI